MIKGSAIEGSDGSIRRMAIGEVYEAQSAELSPIGAITIAWNPVEFLAIATGVPTNIIGNNGLLSAAISQCGLGLD
jgi:hypothetical protein